jgi:tRNA(His) 5'-end guanylyltransferase
MTDSLADRMKMYEGLEAGRRLMPRLPALARLDGRNFSGFTRDLARPYDPRLARLMVAVTTHLVRESAARIGYTQSDEITLLFFADGDAQVYFDGRIHKMVSHLAAQATGLFNRLLPAHLPEKAAALTDETLPAFDCRVWAVPDAAEAANVFLWREHDATKNSLSMAARAHYAHAELDKKRGAELHEMLFAKGVNWNDYPAAFKRGTYVQRRAVRRRFAADELDALPPEHHARRDPDLVVERADYVELAMPPFGRVANREGVVLRGEEPVTVGPTHDGAAP